MKLNNLLSRGVSRISNVRNLKSRKLIIDVIWNTASTGVIKLRGLILVPVITYFCGIEWYGAWVLIYSLTRYALPFSTLLLPNAIVRFFSEEEETSLSIRETEKKLIKKFGKTYSLQQSKKSQSKSTKELRSYLKSFKKFSSSKGGNNDNGDNDNRSTRNSPSKRKSLPDTISISSSSSNANDSPSSSAISAAGEVRSSESHRV